MRRRRQITHHPEPIRQYLRRFFSDHRVVHIFFQVLFQFRRQLSKHVLSFLFFSFSSSSRVVVGVIQKTRVIHRPGRRRSALFLQMREALVVPSIRYQSAPVVFSRPRKRAFQIFNLAQQLLLLLQRGLIPNEQRRVVVVVVIVIHRVVAFLLLVVDSIIIIIIITTTITTTRQK